MSVLDSLFTPLKPSASETAPATPISQPSPSGAATGPNSVNNPLPAGNGTVTAEQAFSALKHTEIPAFSQSSASAQPGAPGTTIGAGAAPAGQAVSIGSLVEGKWAVNMMDSMLPAALVAAFYAMGVKLRKSEIQANEKEKDVLAPIMQKCLDTILLNFDSPWTALAVTAAFIYGGKLTERGVIAWIDQKQEQQQAEALKEKISSADKAENPAKYDPSNQSAADIQSGNVAMPGQYPFTEEDIRHQMKVSKKSRDKAIQTLLKKHAKK